MEQHPEKANNNEPADKAIKADDFDKEKAAADQAGNNRSNTKDKTKTPAEDDVLKEQKETD